MMDTITRVAEPPMLENQVLAVSTGSAAVALVLMKSRTRPDTLTRDLKNR